MFDVLKNPSSCWTRNSDRTYISNSLLINIIIMTHGSFKTIEPCTSTPSSLITMKLSTSQTRRDKTIYKVIVALVQGISVREGAELYHLPESTVHNAFYAPIKTKMNPCCRTALTMGEENSIVAAVKSFPERGTPLSRIHVIETVELVVSRIPPYRIITLPFKH